MCDKTILVNGFRYINEMLLQYQNFKMCETYNLLTSNCINVYSIKRYAFTMYRDDLNRGLAGHVIKHLRDGVLKFDNQIGN